MAFTKAPSISTFQTKDVKLLWSLNNREASTTKDFIALNGFFDVTRDQATKDENYTFVKRDGVAAYLGNLDQSNIRGMYYWEDQDKLYVAYDDKIAIFAGSTGVLSTTITPFTTTTGDVGFTEFYYDSGVTKVVAGDGIKLITIDSSDTVVTGSDADMPEFEPHIMFLDGYIFMIKAGTSDIYQSELNTPLGWTPGDFITAEMIPDTLVRIARLSNYIIALGTASIEYFFDAGNASGSVLQRNDTPVKHIGYLGGFASYSNKVFFVGQATTTGPAVYILEDFKMDVIETPMLRRYLQPDSEYTATIVTIGGHDFYVLTVDGITLMMDLETKVWTRLGYQNTNTLACQYSVNIPISGSGDCSVFSIKGTANLFFFKPSYYTDVGTQFPVSCQTPKIRFDSMHEKYMSRLIPITDKTTGTLYVSWTDDDYSTYSTARTLDLSIEKPMLNRLGRFVERAFKFSLTSSASFRMYHVEIDYNIGLK